MLKGINIDKIKEIKTKNKITAAGGVKSVEEIKKLECKFHSIAFQLLEAVFTFYCKLIG